MDNLTSVLKDLQQERNRLSVQLEGLNRALSLLHGTSSNRTRNTISAAGRARIAAAQRARWQRSRGTRLFQSPLIRYAQCPQPRVRGLSLLRKHAGRSGGRPKRRVSLCISLPK